MSFCQYPSLKVQMWGFNRRPSKYNNNILKSQCLQKSNFLIRPFSVKSREGDFCIAKKLSWNQCFSTTFCFGQYYPINSNIFIARATLTSTGHWLSRYAHNIISVSYWINVNWLISYNFFYNNALPKHLWFKWYTNPARVRSKCHVHICLSVHVTIPTEHKRTQGRRSRGGCRGCSLPLFSKCNVETTTL